jgi:hypothetical protein
MDKELPSEKGFIAPSGKELHGLSDALREQDVFELQTDKRRGYLKDISYEIARLKSVEEKDVGVVAFISSAKASIDPDDIFGFASMLKSIGDVPTLVLIVDSFGGDGTTAERIVNLCRSYCKELLVAIPLRAKSAATLVCLGADKLYMGHCSEIGPIDAQVPVAVGGVIQFISAYSFIHAAETLDKEFQEKASKGEDPRNILQKIAGLDYAYISHCQKLLAFSSDLTRKYLSNFMFRELPKRERDRIIKKVTEKLCIPKSFKVHGQVIDSHAARELGLYIDILGKESKLWNSIWGYYVRAFALMESPFGRGCIKIFESQSEVILRRMILTD